RDQHPLQSVSVETNPDDLEKDSVHHLRDSGVNRLSVGVQSFDDALLEQMQRLEKYGSGEMIVDRLRRSAGVFDTLNVDMIFNFPRQTEASLRRDLGMLTDEIGVDQVSWYPLMSAESTRRPMRQHMGGEVDRSRERGFYELIAEHMLGAGYERSSAWCFSRQPGLFDEYIVEHDEYVGLGSGAFSYLQGQLFASTFSINHYCRLVDSGRSGVVQRRSLSERDQMRYYLLMKLFSGAMDLGAAEDRFSSRFARVLWPELAALRALGAARQEGGRLRLTDRGHFLWVVMMREFFAGVSDLRDAMRHHISEERFPSQDQ
ncbi:MAG: coproporphyrinogen III oxidase, partial [Gammaproteobacteria bacterium]|nr:coproporphyrinogen III oxidase [Gammaproteobacteria bacterium]